MTRQDAVTPVTDQFIPMARYPETHGGQILVAMLAAIETFGEIDPNRVARCLERDIVGMVKHGVPYQPDTWFPGLTMARRKAYSRATMRLEGNGLAVRITEPHRDRVIYVRPTLSGLLIAFEIAEHANPDTVYAGLRRTRWGDALADDLVRALELSAPQT